MTGFTPDWLRRRNSFDRTARDAALARRFAAALPGAAGRPLQLLDLGAGSGANFRALAPVIGVDQEWQLIDHDDALLDTQAGEHLAWAAREGHDATAAEGRVIIRAAGARWTAQGRRLDLARELDHLEASACDGVTMAALIDLVSARWLDALVASLARRRKPLLAVLGVDGRRLWHPATADDAVLAAAFAQHQNGDKGFGPALGAGAPFRLADRLAAHGFSVDMAQSDWQVGPDHRAMLADLIAGEAAAASAARPDQAATIAAWAARRREEAAAGLLSVTIGHRDILAVPPDI